MSTAQTVIVTVIAVPVSAAALFLLAYLAYGAVARDIAGRLRTRAELLDRACQRPELVAGIRYAAETVDGWSSR
ncbi:hypothetical protein ACIRJO_02820 [Streptomyces sp. NPDC102394]|uniref:hypothetical protein n=1 Tax=Streptomyces sp. NPDC102394 TaxID=3366167 RepID=UPI00382B8928